MMKINYFDVNVNRAKYIKVPYGSKHVLKSCGTHRGLIWAIGPDSARIGPIWPCLLGRLSFC